MDAGREFVVGQRRVALQAVQQPAIGGIQMGVGTVDTFICEAILNENSIPLW